MIPESHDAKSLSGEPQSARRVGCFSVSVLASIDFDNQLLLETDEIADVPTNRRLSSELRPFHLPIA
jgi:hypothetical protein